MRHKSSGWAAIAFGLVAVAMAIIGHVDRKTPTDGDPSRADGFKPGVMLHCPPAADQGRTSLCWIYAMLRTIEIDCLMEGDSVRLSPNYLARKLIEEQADRAYFAARHKRQADISMRGMATDCLYLLNRYGAVPLQSYPQQAVGGDALCRSLVDMVRLSGSLSEMHSCLKKKLDATMGILPQAVYMLGMRYTEQEFAHSVCLPGQYEAFASATHHPFGERFAIESPDNRYGVEVMNVPIDSLLSLTVQALRSGHAVCWEGDISETGFRQDKGTANFVENANTVMLQRQRQQQIESGQTTDDHCLTIIGEATRDNGHHYLIAQNSWGDVGPYHGIIYMSDDYFLMKTLMVVMRR